MFDIAPTELIVLGTVALLVIPPKDLPRAMRTAGYWVGRARGVARQFRSGFDTMVRDAELAEMEQRWKAENERIMREHPPTKAADAAMAEPAGPTMVPAPTFLERPATTDEAPVTPHVPQDPSTAERPVSVASPVVVPADPPVPPAADAKATS